MSGLHLNHKLTWTDALQLYTFTQDPGIELPVGICQKIHIINKETEIKVENRNYLSNQICTNSDCSSHDKFKRFYKNTTKATIDLGKRSKTYKNDEDDNDMRFIQQFTNAIVEFAETERKKYQRVIYTNNKKLNSFDEKQYADYLKNERMKKDYRWLTSVEEEEILFNSCLCWFFHFCIEVGDVETLLSFTNDQIQSVFHCLHGGQAVGNNSDFLMYHIMKTYIFTNLIYAAPGLIDQNEKWGPMTPNDYFRNILMSNCDGQTFLYQSRSYLMDEVYMKDITATNQLCKNCFKYMYILFMLKMEVDGKKEAIQWLKHILLLIL